MDNVETLATPKQFNLGLIAYFIMSFGLGVLVCALIFMYFKKIKFSGGVSAKNPGK